MFKNRTGARYIYETLTKSIPEDENTRVKWQSDLEVQLSEDNWDSIYNICHNTVKDNDIIWLQYRILNRILGTNKLRFAMSQINSNKCRLCQIHEESLFHMFYDCDITKQFHNNLRKWIENKTKFKIPVDALTYILGYLTQNQYFVPVNTVLLLAKKYLFTCAYLKDQPNIHAFLAQFESVFKEQELLARINNRLEDFNNNLGRWRALFE